MSFRKILVPIDFDETSDHALTEALILARKLGAKVTVVHVYDLPVYNFPDGSYIPTAEVAESVRAGAAKQLEGYVEKRRALGHDIDSLLREGRAIDEIERVAKEIGADLIVMGTHGRGLLGRALLGSVAQGVLRQSTVPVMTVRASAP
jgi:nucleotide-binding universal stress UspA family protein